MNSKEDVVLCTEAENRAEQAQGLESIGAFNLASIKRTVSHFLAGIGGGSIFEEYTKHDISHINEMLRLVEWLAPSQSQKFMTPTEWLHVVLSVYFHDLGMFVTAREYEARGQTGFDSFKEKILFSGPNANDYRAKVEALGSDRSERFFYQEFVRYNHAKRIRAWITGTPAPDLGVTEVAREVARLVEPLGEQFRGDLGVICESHHLDDLDNLKKYSLSRAYGRSDKELANLQYAAILLRSADLLHMTKDRTPSVMYRVTNPTDPISQREWRKQMGVNRVCPKMGTDADGNVSESAPQDTVEVHAFFTEADPFFALSSFLNYVEKQLQLCHQWSERGAAAGARQRFPWRWIDRENIEAKGFYGKVFAFELDQPKILNLLTGHTLYDNSGVVLRELVQNSIDAVKLQRYSDANSGRLDSTTAGITVEWREPSRTLIVQDVGTGMSQEVIESHLLRVGSSRYATEKFREEHPNFFPISRFGIGILTAFMIADDVEIFTCSPDEEEARHIILRNLHGKYLIKLLSKADEKIRPISPHGTRIELRLRPSARLPDVEEILRTWIVVPDCRVTLVSGGRDSVHIGHTSIAEALEQSLVRMEIPVSKEGVPRQGDVRVFHVHKGFADVAFACRWSESFQEWDFLTLRNEAVRLPRAPILLGTCIEGIRVETSSAGYDGVSVCVMANASGAGSPRTNVARSGLEKTVESRTLSRLIYQSLFDFLNQEVEQVRARRNLSMTGALSEGKYLLAPLLTNPADRDAFEECVRELPLLMIEQQADRRTISPKKLESYAAIWTVDCPLFRSAESLLREADSDASLSKVVEVISDNKFPSEPILCGGGLSEAWALSDRGIDEILVNRESRRVDIRWSRGVRGRYWKGISHDALLRVIELPEIRGFDELNELVRDRSIERVFVSTDDAKIVGLESEVCIRASGTSYFVGRTLPGKVVRAAIEGIEAGGDSTIAITSVLALTLVRNALTRARGRKFDETAVERYFARPRFDYATKIDSSELTAALNEISTLDRVFDPSASERPQPMPYAQPEW